MKKIINAVLGMVFCLAIIFPAWAAELGADAVREGKVPVSYATLKGDNIVYGKAVTSYSPDLMDKILTAYGGTFQPDAKVPTSYATVKNGNIVFGKTAVIYSPDLTHEILTAYGFSTTPEAMEELKDPYSYATVKNGKIIFGTQATAYNPEEFNMLMAAYQLPEEVKPEVTVEPKPVAAATVIPKKCPDADGDGVCDGDDKCLGTPKGAKVDERGCWVIDSQWFDYDKSTLKPEYYPGLDEVVSVLKANPDASVAIIGNTCDIGPESYNQKLSERRAKVVFDYIVKKGIEPQRLSWKGYGEKQPAYPNTTETNRARNRRVELSNSTAK